MAYLMWFLRRVLVTCALIHLHTVASSSSDSAFNTFDADQSGGITLRELRTGMKLLGHDPTTKQLDDFFAETDSDSSGTVTFKEFLVLMEKEQQRDEARRREEQMDRLFRIYDKNADRYISREELASLLYNSGARLSKKALSDVMNGEERLDFKEFLQVVENMKTP